MTTGKCQSQEYGLSSSLHPPLRGGASWTTTMPPKQRSDNLSPLPQRDERGGRQQLMFTGPRKVEIRSEEEPQLQAGEVEVTAAYSAISAGTELKVFEGTFDHDPVGDSFSRAGSYHYPMPFGYSMVGTLSKIGAKTPKQVGERVFAFAPHGSHAIVSHDRVMAVPNHVGLEDAVFFPSMETALCLVHDAAPLVGERVAVVGQGIIGLLVTSILARMPLSVSVFDLDPNRLAQAKALAHPHELHTCSRTCECQQRFDVCIEVTGHEAGLQLALDRVMNGGKVVVGSWFGQAAVGVRLGTRIHRSHASLVFSQVSVIRAALRDRWDKPRRSKTVWNLLAAIGPATTLVSHRVPFTQEQVQHVYEQLAGREQGMLQVLLEYKTGSPARAMPPPAAASRTNNNNTNTNTTSTSATSPTATTTANTTKPPARAAAPSPLASPRFTTPRAPLMRAVPTPTSLSPFPSKAFRGSRGMQMLQNSIERVRGDNVNKQPGLYQQRRRRLDLPTFALSPALLTPARESRRPASLTQATPPPTNALESTQLTASLESAPPLSPTGGGPGESGTGGNGAQRKPIEQLTGQPAKATTTTPAKAFSGQPSESKGPSAKRGGSRPPRRCGRKGARTGPRGEGARGHLRLCKHEPIILILQEAPQGLVLTQRS
eukprot:g51557.t1